MSASSSVPACSAEDHTLGALDARVVIIEYADFECPNCKQAESMIMNLRARHGAELCIVYRHFPLQEVHPYALLAAQASEAAGAQGKFWEMHDLLFEHQDLLDASRLETCAVQLGLDLPLFTSELEGARYLDRVRDQIDGANACACARRRRSSSMASWLTFHSGSPGSTSASKNCCTRTPDQDF